MKKFKEIQNSTAIERKGIKKKTEQTDFLRSAISYFSDDKFLGCSINKARNYEKIQRNSKFDSNPKKRNRGKTREKIPFLRSCCSRSRSIKRKTKLTSISTSIFFSLFLWQRWHCEISSDFCFLL